MSKIYTDHSASLGGALTHPHSIWCLHVPAAHLQLPRQLLVKGLVVLEVLVRVKSRLAGRIGVRLGGGGHLNRHALDRLDDHLPSLWFDDGPVFDSLLQHSISSFRSRRRAHEDRQRGTLLDQHADEDVLILCKLELQTIGLAAVTVHGASIRKLAYTAQAREKLGYARRLTGSWCKVEPIVQEPKQANMMIGNR